MTKRVTAKDASTFMSKKIPLLEGEGYDDPKQRVAIALSMGRKEGVRGLPPEPAKKAKKKA